jgi:hypothetical protein
MIRTVANANFFTVPTSDDDSSKRTAVDLPLRYNRNSTTKKYDTYASQQPYLYRLMEMEYLMVQKITVRMFTRCVPTFDLTICGLVGKDAIELLIMDSWISPLFPQFMHNMRCLRIVD